MVLMFLATEILHQSSLGSGGIQLMLVHWKLIVIIIIYHLHIFSAHYKMYIGAFQ